jgi:hypothetical protein
MLGDSSPKTLFYHHRQFLVAALLGFAAHKVTYRCTPGPMDECINLSCDVVVYDRGDGRNVETTSSYVGGNNNISAFSLLNGFNGFESCFLFKKGK